MTPQELRRKRIEEEPDDEIALSMAYEIAPLLLDLWEAVKREEDLLATDDTAQYQAHPSLYEDVRRALAALAAFKEEP